MQMQKDVAHIYSQLNSIEGLIEEESEDEEVNPLDASEVGLFVID